MKCLYCGKEFEPRRRGQKYCSVKCQRKNYVKQVEEKMGIARCLNCGRKFYKGNSKQKYCSEECQRRYRNPKTRQLGTIKCPVCGKEFRPRTVENKCCSEKCYFKLRHSTPREEDRTGRCLHCGRQLELKSPNQKFCSDLCGARYRCGSTKGKDEYLPPPDAPVIKSFEDYAREAEECNLDYGNYRAMLQMGKTYEELKATADKRLPLQHHRRSYLLN